MKGRHRVYHIDVYDRDLIIIDSDDMDYVNGLLSDHEATPNSIGEVLMDKHGEYYGIYMIFNSKEENFKPSVIAHEAVHGAMCLFEYIGYRPHVRNDETLAYLVEWIFEQAFNYIYEGEDKG